MNPLQRDYNRDGLITEADYAIGARQMGMGPGGEQAARVAFRHHDRNQNRILDPHEFRMATPGMGSNIHMGRVFNPNIGNPLVRDYNNDGLITEADYVIGARQLGWGPLGEQIARAAFKHHDKDRNGFLDSREAELARRGF
jgi:hypothetical protein